jgi:hypothetical protein
MCDTKDVPITLQLPFDGAEIRGQLAVTMYGFLRYDRAFSEYDDAIRRLTPKHSATSAHSFMHMLTMRGECGHFYECEKGAFHPAFVQPMLARFGSHLPDAKVTNASAIVYANALVSDVNAQITQYVSKRPLKSIVAWRGALLPEWGQFDIERIGYELGRSYDAFIADNFSDPSDAPPWLQLVDGKLASPGTHAFISDSLDRTVALIRSHPSIGPMASDNAFASALDGGGTYTNGVIESTNGHVIVDASATSAFFSELIDSNGTPLLLIEKETSMFYVSAMIRKHGKHATNMINGAEFQEYIAIIQDQYGLTREQVCTLRLSPDGNNNGYYVHYLVAMEVAAKCDVRYKLEMNTIVARYLRGDVTTEESKGVAKALARSVGVITRDGDVDRAGGPVAFAAFKHRLTQEMGDRIDGKDSLITDQAKWLKSSENDISRLEKTNDGLRSEIAELKKTLTLKSPYYIAWKMAEKEVRDVYASCGLRMRVMEDKVATMVQKESETDG